MNWKEYINEGAEKEYKKQFSKIEKELTDDINSMKKGHNGAYNVGSSNKLNQTRIQIYERLLNNLKEIKQNAINLDRDMKSFHGNYRRRPGL